MNRDWWKKRGLDLWSIPHFLFGVITALAGPLFALSFLSLFALTVGAALAWELFEKCIGIRESFRNILLDIVLSALALVLTSYLLLAYPLAPEAQAVAAAAVFLLFAFTNISGWRAYRRRNRDFRG